MQIFGGSHDPRHAGATPPHASNVVPVVEVVLLVELVELELLVVVGHGSGVHEPGPRSVPPSSAQSAGDSGTQMKAPAGEPGTQHCVMAGALVVVVLVVGVLVELVLAAHGSGTHDP